MLLSAYSMQSNLALTTFRTTQQNKLGCMPQNIFQPSRIFVNGQEPSQVEHLKLCHSIGNLLSLVGNFRPGDNIINLFSCNLRIFIIS